MSMYGDILNADRAMKRIRSPHLVFISGLSSPIRPIRVQTAFMLSLLFRVLLCYAAFIDPVIDGYGHC